MRRIILLCSIILLSAVWTAVAQSGSALDSESGTTSNKITVEGCLDGAIGTYTLTDYAGASYRLAEHGYVESSRWRNHAGDGSSHARCAFTQCHERRH
jgi:hypothetical protein